MDGNDLGILRAIRLKLVAPTEHVAVATATEPAVAEQRVRALVDAGLVSETPRGWRLTPAGQESLVALLERERAGVDGERARALHERFVRLDGRLKQLVTGHQLSGAEQLADDARQELADVHGAALGIVDEAVALAPRLGPYRARLDAAHAAVAAGDVRLLAHPMLDSYHNVWFELHEELIHLAGIDRASLGG